MLQSRLRIVVIGDEGVGKTCLINALMKKELPEKYTPTTYENHCFDQKVLGKLITISLRDTAGRSSLDGFRSLCFGGADIFLVCFSIDSRQSFKNVQEKWLAELKVNSKGAKIIIIETKTDKYHDLKSQFLEYVLDSEIQKLCVEEDVDGFLAVNTKDDGNNNIDLIFPLALRLCVLKKRWVPPAKRK